jgi:hypothetical protein
LAYSRWGLALALGAGVSAGSGTPDWPTLLERVAVACCGPRGNELVRTLRREGYSLPFIANAIQTVCPEDPPFTEVVRRELYASFSFDGQRIDWADPKKFANYIRANRAKFAAEVGERNSTLRAVAAMCVERVPGAKQYQRNPRVHAVVNFNVDSIFRAYVENRYFTPGRRPLVRTVERASKEAQLGKTNVYHPHGNLRFDPTEGDHSRDAPDKLVLAEGEYFDFFNNPTSLFTYTFLSVLREHPVLFVGLSMQDDNIRRLLHYSTREREQAYVEERKAGFSIQKAKEKAIRHFAILRWREGSDDLNDLRRETLRRLGTRVLWIDDYGQIEARLGQIYEAEQLAPRKWAEVI